MNTTASLLRTTHRPFGRSTAVTTDAPALGARIRQSLRHRRFDDRSFVERNASVSELTLRGSSHAGARF